MNARTGPLEGLEVRSKLWLERGGKVALSDWRVELLLAIDETGSLTAAAERMAVPYRTAWYKLREAEDELGVPLVSSESGGARGGGSRLTPEGRRIAERFRQAAREVDELAQERLADEFGSEVK